MTCHADKLRAKPDAKLTAAMKGLPAASKASQSEVVHQRDFSDGSQLLASSREGGAVELKVVEDSAAAFPVELTDDAPEDDAPEG